MKLRTELSLGYALILVFMLVIAVIAFQSFSSFTETVTWVSHTHEVISKAHKVEKLLVDMETGQRGFLITGSEEFLEPYNNGVSEYKTTIADLKSLVSDNSSQLTRLKKIEALVDKWQKVAAQPEINERRKVVKGAIDADHLQDVLVKGVGKSILDEMRGIMDSMEEHFRLDGNMKGQALTGSVAKAMVDQETGQRGFLITGKDEFLEPYRTGQLARVESLKSLRTLLANAHDRITTDDDLNQLESLAVTWLKEAGEVEIALRREVDAGRKTYKHIENRLRQGKGKATLDAMRLIMDRMDAMFKRAENERARSLIILLGKAMVDQETGQRGFLITGKNKFLEPLNQGQKLFKQTIIDLRRLNTHAYDIAVMTRDINKLDQLADDWIKKAAMPEIAARRVMNESVTSMKDVQSLIEKGTGKTVMDSLRVNLAEFVGIEEELLAEREKKTKDTAILNKLTVIIGTIIALVLGMLAMFFTARRLLKQLGGEPNEIATITEQIAQGHLDVETCKPGEGTGIFASVGTMAVALRLHRDDTEKQDWLNTGQNLLNEKIRGDLDIFGLTNSVIHFLAEYLEAQIGAVYVLEQDSDMLHLMGSYAFTKRKGLNDRIQVGQGLVGEAARTKKMISVTELPEDYTRISSAIGDAHPVNIVVVPLTYEGNLKGVIELGSFKEFFDTSLEFINGITEMIATGINSAQSRIQLQNLLAETQMQSEELQSQQEELKASNENLIEHIQTWENSCLLHIAVSLS